jgi:hypothetical protein
MSDPYTVATRQHCGKAKKQLANEQNTAFLRIFNQGM